jgi:hypothetical protein
LFTTLHVEIASQYQVSETQKTLRIRASPFSPVGQSPNHTAGFIDGVEVRVYNSATWAYKTHESSIHASLTDNHLRLLLDRELERNRNKGIYAPRSSRAPSL